MPADPTPERPQVALPDDVKNYALWLERQVAAVDKAVQAFLADPQQPFSEREAVQFVVTVGRGISWNKWLLGWRWFLAKHFELLPPAVVSFFPIPMEIPTFDWDAVQRFHVELEQWRAEFKSLGVPVPDATELPNKPPPALDSIETIIIGLAVVASVGGVVYLVHKFA